jgi:hypothetical protein
MLRVQTPRSVAQDIGGGSGRGHSYGLEAHAAATTIQAWARAGWARAEAKERRQAVAVLAVYNARWFNL